MAYPKGTFYTSDGKNYIDNVTILNAEIVEPEVQYPEDGTTINGVAYKAISVNCTNNYTLTDAQKNATVIVISASGSSKTLTLGMSNGQQILIVNSGENNVTIKNDAEDTGVEATKVKAAYFAVIGGAVIKTTADA